MEGSVIIWLKIIGVLAAIGAGIKLLFYPIKFVVCLIFKIITFPFILLFKIINNFYSKYKTEGDDYYF